MTSKNSVYTPSKMETKAERTTAAATEIIDAENGLRDAKTERLRQARLKYERDEKAVADATPKPAAKKTRAKSKAA
jgi:hypothetical protein